MIARSLSRPWTDSAFGAEPRVIAAHGRHTVLAQRQEVMWRDGSAVGLHPVCLDGRQQIFLRALKHEGLLWHVFDLRHLLRDIEADALRLPKHDTPGLVFYGLRGAYKTAGAFTADVLAGHTLACWWVTDGVAVAAAA